MTAATPASTPRAAGSPAAPGTPAHEGYLTMPPQAPAKRLPNAQLPRALHFWLQLPDASSSSNYGQFRIDDLEVADANALWNVLAGLPMPSDILKAPPAAVGDEPAAAGDAAACAVDAAADDAAAGGEGAGASPGYHLLVQHTATGMRQCNGLMVFVRGVEPRWEAPLNRNGSHMQTIMRRHVFADEGMDHVWLVLVLGVASGEPTAVMQEARRATEAGERVAVDNHLPPMAGSIEGDDSVERARPSNEPRVLGCRLVNKLAGRSANLRAELWHSAATPAERSALRTWLQKRCNGPLKATLGGAKLAWAPKEHPSRCSRE